MIKLRGKAYCRMFLIVVMLLHWLSPVVYACTPALPDEWFVEHINVSPPPLPPGVSIDVIAETRYQITRDVLLIKNSSHTPLYLIGHAYMPQYQFEPISMEFPAGIGPTHKVLNNQSFNWYFIINVYDEIAAREWRSEIDYEDAIALSIYRNNTLSSSNGYVVELEPRNRTGDNRPANPDIPPPQHAQFTIVYGDEKIQIPITVSYAVNENYDPASVEKSANGCGSMDTFITMSMVVLMVRALFMEL